MYIVEVVENELVVIKNVSFDLSVVNGYFKVFQRLFLILARSSAN